MANVMKQKKGVCMLINKPCKTLQSICAKSVAQLLVTQHQILGANIKTLPLEIKQKILDELGTLPISRPIYLDILYGMLIDVESIVIDKRRYSKAPEIVDGDVQKLITKMTNLQKISLRGNKFLTQPKVESTHITEIDFSSNKFKLFNPIWIDCPNLRTLRLNPSAHILLRTLRKLSKTAPLLKTLDLSCVVDLRDFHFGEETKIYFPNLEELILRSCVRLEYLTVQSTTLKVLDLGLCLALHDETIQALLPRCPNLEILDLRECSKLHSFAQIVHHFPKPPT